MASDLLLETPWEESFEKQYGYALDAFDIIAKMGYDIEPLMSKNKEHNQQLLPFIWTDKTMKRNR